MITRRTSEATQFPNRYQAGDFYKLTNKQASSPVSPEIGVAHVDRAESTSVQTGAADKRPIFDRGALSCNEQGQGKNNIRKPCSVSAVAEDIHGTAQSFLESGLHGLPQGESGDVGSCNCCCRCGRAREWKSFRPRGVRRTKSYSPLRTGVSELSGWTWASVLREEPVDLDAPRSFKPGEAPLERLPVEILDQIISQLALGVPPSNYTPRNIDLVSCLLTSRTIHVAAISTLYNRITIPRSSIFFKFLSHVSQYPALGSIVRRLDLSHFTSVGLGRSGQMNKEIQNMTSKTLLQCLELTTGVQELLLQEHLDGDIDETVLHKILFDLPSLQAVDFCAASSVAFVDAFSSAVTRLNVPLPLKLGIRRLSLHECFTLSSSSLEALLPRLPYLTHLDLYHTRVTNKALESISKTAKVSHLNLGKCTYISGDGLVDFLATHVAVRTLVYLNLCCDISCYRLLWEFDVDRLLPLLPSTLRSLNLNGAKVRPSHVPLLLPLTKHLEELSLGSADLSMRDINSLFLPKPESVTDVDSALSHEETKWVPSTLCYLDLSGIASISQSSIFSSSCVLLGSMTSPLEVLELGDKAISSLRECKNTNKMVGWVVKECGRRGWYVREPLTDAPGGKSGRRNWKMGAVWWGMRKIPVAWGEVAGLYGHYMFKK